MTETPDPVYRLATSQPDTPAIITPQATISYQALNDQVAAAAMMLTGCGVQANDRVAISVEPTTRCLVAIAALFRIGAVAGTINPNQPTAILNSQIARLSPTRIVADHDPPLPNHCPHITYDKIENAPPSPTASTADPAPWPLYRFATMMFTSGSTDEPKIAVHTWGNHYFSAVGSAMNIPFGPGDRWFLSLPLYHVGGLSIPFRAWTGGGAVAIPDQDIDLIDSILSLQATHLSVVPTQLQQLLEHSDRMPATAGQIKHLLVGGGPINDKLVKQALQANLPIHTSYGATEMSSQITTTSRHDLPRHTGTAGRLLPHREMKIGNNSEIMVKGDTLFAGYFEPDSVARPTNDNGWFATGDLGKLDPDGYLTVLGRRDNLIISGGENIQPEEIERALMALRGVESAIVVAIPDRRFGQRPVAFVQMQSDGEIESEHFRNELSDLLPAFKIPDAFLPYPDADEQSGLKPSRKALSQKALDLLTQR